MKIHRPHPLISVIVTSYNHEKYIDKALKSILSQKGYFYLEIIVGDDFSEDGTIEILRQHQKKNPAVLRLLQFKENIGVTRNIQSCLNECKGDYIAFCEGDDYWTDPNKLDEQVRFLEGHKECSMCFNTIVIRYEDENRSDFHPIHTRLIKQGRRILNTFDLISENFIGNFSACMYRGSIVKAFPESLFEMYTVDWMFNIYCSRYGDVGFVQKPMSVYRIHKSGAWSGENDELKYTSWIHNIEIYNRYLGFEYNAEFVSVKKRVFMMLATQALTKLRLSRLFTYWKKTGYKLWFFRMLCQGIVKKLMRHLRLSVRYL